MKTSSYLQTVRKRASADYKGVADRLNAKNNRLALINHLKDAQSLLNGLDLWKKHLIYGAKAPNTFLNCDASEELPELNMTNEQVDLFHGLFGSLTEAGEIIKPALDLLLNKELDKQNIMEELGDQTWYTGLCILSLNTSFEEVFAFNNAKLDKRYPIGFTEENALVRDIASEMIAATATLEAKPTKLEANTTNIS